jgi:cytoskeletal protein CcmA (bactofilin family)
MSTTQPSIFFPKPLDTPTPDATSAFTPVPKTVQQAKPTVTTNHLAAPNPAERHPGAHPSLSSSTVAYVPNSSHPVSGVIGPRMVIKGDIEFEGELMIQGRVTGNIRSQDDGKSILRIDEKAEVIGDVDVPVIKVSGTLRGTVSANELLHLHPTGTIIGPVKYNNIQLESGGTLEGSLTPEFKNARK